MPDLCLSQASLHSKTSFASIEVKKEPFVLISCHQRDKAAAQKSILLDLLNTGGFCKRTSTASTYTMHTERSRIHLFLRHLLSTHYMPGATGTRKKFLSSVPSVFKSNLTELSKIEAVRKPNDVSLHFLDNPIITGTTKGFKIMKPTTSIRDYGGLVARHFCWT